MKKIIVFFIIIIASSNLFARKFITILDVNNGRDLFEINIADQGEQYDGGRSKWTLTQDYIDALVIGMEYWASLIGNSHLLGVPALISIGTYNDKNAEADARYNSDGQGKTILAQEIYEEKDDIGTLIRIGILPNAYFGQMSILPKNTQGYQIAAVMVHEVGHAMGIASSNNGSARFKSYDGIQYHWNKYDSHLYDSFGHQIKFDMSQPITLVSEDAENNNFQVLNIDLDDGVGYRFGYVYFWDSPSGESEVSKVLKDGGIGDGILVYGNLNPNNQPGIPINGFEWFGGSSYLPELSHVELRNSMMSHQQYRNWNTFMEAELALLQDVGVDIKREDFYGRSIYYNANGTAGINGNIIVSNDFSGMSDSDLAIGLHIYGTSNTVIMQSAVDANGFGSAGIRVDGWYNNLTINTDIKVNGVGATGLMVAYGRNHSIIHKGNIEATGDDGIGVRFDFGGNILGNTTEYRGSYIRTESEPMYWDYNPHARLPYELQGPLISTFNVIGTIKGDQVAIYISENAFVREINIMKGATISGDIISDWNPNNSLIQRQYANSSLITNLTLGLKPTAEGFVTSDKDEDFTLEFSGNIISPKSIDMTVHGGTLTFSGEKMILASFTIMPEATVKFLVTSINTEIDATQISAKPESIIIVNIDTTDMTQDSLRYNEGGSFSIVNFNSRNLSLANKIVFEGDTDPSDLPALEIGFYDYPKGSFEYYIQGGLPRVRLSNTNRTLSTQRTGFNQNVSVSPLLIALHNPAGNFIFKRTQEIWDKNLYGKNNKLEVWSRAMSNSIKGKSDYDISGIGIAGGIDFWFSKSFFVGVGANLENPQYKADVADNKASFMRTFIYGGTFINDDLELNAFIAKAKPEYKQIRKSGGQQYSAKYKGEQLEVGLELEKVFDMDEKTKLIPFINYEYISLELDGFNESGGTYNLHYDYEPSTTHQINLGSKLKYDISSKFSATAQGLFKILLGEKQGKADFSFAADPDKIETLPVQGQEADTISIGLGLDLHYALSKKLNLNASYNLTTGSNQTNHQLGLDLSIRFK